jgi:membrane protein required for beta-lactamase induction
MVANATAEELAILQQQASDLEARAEAEERAYQRATWLRFVGVFFPIPFVVVLLRLELDAWTYYAWGALIVLIGGVLYVVDTAASTRVGRTVEAAAKARRAYDEARARHPV